MDGNDPYHAAVAETLRRERGALIVSAFAASQADYLVLDRLGQEAEVAFIADMA